MGSLLTFLKGLQEGDADNDGNVDVKEVFEYLNSKVRSRQNGRM